MLKFDNFQENSEKSGPSVGGDNASTNVEGYNEEQGLGKC